MAREVTLSNYAAIFVKVSRSAPLNLALRLRFRLTKLYCLNLTICSTIRQVVRLVWMRGKHTSRAVHVSLAVVSRLFGPQQAPEGGQWTGARAGRGRFQTHRGRNTGARNRVLD